MIYETCLMWEKAEYFILEILSFANAVNSINLKLISLYNQVNHLYRAFKIEFTVMKNDLEKCAKKFNYQAE